MNYVREALHGITRQKIVTGMLLVQLIISFTLIQVLFCSFTTAVQNQNRFENHFIESEIYRLSDISPDDVIGDYINEIAGLQKLKRFHESLLSNKGYIYLEKNYQMCSIVDFAGSRIFFDGYESGYSNPPYVKNQKNYIDVKACQLNYNAIQLYRLSIIEGRMLTPDDMVFVNDRIPVLLGYEYDGIYEIGDIIEGEYLLSDYQFEVVGMLEKNSAAVDGDNLFYLDRYIMMPSLTWITDPTSKNDMFTQGATYINKINGEIALVDGYTLKEFVSYLESCRLTHGMHIDFTVLSQNIIALSIIKASAYESYSSMNIVIALLFIFVGFSTFFAIKYKTGKSITTYSILMLCDYSIIEIKRIVILEFFVLFTISLLLSFLVTLVMLGSFFRIQYFMIAVFCAYSMLLLVSQSLKIKDFTNKAKGN